MLRNQALFPRLSGRLGLMALAAVALAGCAETQLAVHTAKRVGAPGSVEVPAGGAYKIGEPYQIAGTWYYPKEDYSYVETGVASWYGPDFHGKSTANGEIYDMNDLTAAHRTLPLPSVVRVTNLDNGRSLVLRVNDRGPFAKNRIIDVSRRGAQLLGFEGKGTTRVKVQILREESIALRDALLKGGGGGRIMVASADTDMDAAPVPETAVPSAPVSVPAPEPLVRAQPAPVVVAAPLPEPESQARASVTMQAPSPAPMPSSGQSRVISTPPGSTLMPAAGGGGETRVAAAPAGAYIQAGAFSSMGNAQRLEGRLKSFGATVIEPVNTASGRLFRVRIGPLASADAAERLLGQVRAAGHPQAVVVVD